MRFLFDMMDKLLNNSYGAPQTKGEGSYKQAASAYRLAAAVIVDRWINWKRFNAEY